MNDIHFLTVVMMVSGWLLHQWLLLSRLTRLKGVLVTPWWYAKNRPYKALASALTSTIGTILAYIWFEPQAITDGKELVMYLATVLAIGSGMDWVTDKVGHKVKLSHAELEDDGKTVRIRRD